MSDAVPNLSVLFSGFECYLEAYIAFRSYHNRDHDSGFRKSFPRLAWLMTSILDKAINIKFHAKLIYN